MNQRGRCCKKAFPYVVSWAISVALAMAGLAGIAGLTRQLERAARLFGAAQASLANMGIVLDAIDLADWDRDIQAVKTQLNPALYAALWAERSGMSLEQAVEDAFAFATENQSSKRN